VLHAVADALLGAAGLGDLGRLFPADARTPKGIASADLLAEVLRQLASAGVRPASVDVTIVGARPRLGNRLDDIAARVASLLDIDRTAVSLKASTGNLVGMEGAGRAISARVVATVEPRP
jgi:2-C-methyl-D-erythritol 2,4-cyclodiphosphate synthase